MSLKRLVRLEPAIRVSFEFFPPKTEDMEVQLWQAIRRLAPLAPSFVSVTYGAGGSTRDRTHATVKRIIEETCLLPAAHLTCVGASRAQIDDIVRAYWQVGVRHIVALRGDMPDAGAPYQPHPDGYLSTAELVRGIRAIAPFEVSVSAYPERHPESPSFAHDLALLKAKADAGASRALTQFCFSTEAMARFRDEAARQNIAMTIVPGLIPTTNIKGIARMAVRSGAQVPDWLLRLYDGLDHDLETRRLIAANVLVEQVEELSAEGFEQFHFYTLNQADLTYAACRILGLGVSKTEPEKDLT